MTTPSAPAPLAGRLRFENFALAVGDLSVMALWYEAILGLTPYERGRFDAVGADYVMMQGEGLRLELVSRPHAPQTPTVRVDPPHHLGELGWRALVLETDDLVAVSQALADLGVEFVWRDQAISATRRSSLLRDPEGNLINIFGPEGQV